MAAYWHLVFDGILILAASVIIILCTHNGFVRSVLSLGKTILSLILAWIFGGAVKNWLATGLLGNWIRDSVHSMFLGMYESGAEAFDLSKAVNGIPEALRALLVNLNVNMEEITAFGSESAATAEQLKTLSSVVSEPIVDFVSAVAGYLCVFCVSMFLITILIHVSDLVTSLPVIHFCNQTLGFVLGVFLALVIVILLSRVGAALLVLATSSDPSSQFMGVYEKTHIMQYFNRMLGYGV